MSLTASICSINKLIEEDYPHLFETDKFKGTVHFHGLGNALAVGEGAGDGMHVDPGDSRWTHAIIFSVGEAVVHFCIPQLGLRIPLLAGQCLTFPACLLSHYAYVLEGTGDRVLFNFFTDNHSMAKATRQYGLNHSVSYDAQNTVEA